MKAMRLAMFGVLLSAGAASAQGVGAHASSGAYGQAWAEIHRAKCQNANRRLHQSEHDRATGHPAAAHPISVN
jgi:hypothetical protein